MVQYSKVQCSTVQYSKQKQTTVKYGTVQYITVQCGILFENKKLKYFWRMITKTYTMHTQIFIIFFVVRSHLPNNGCIYVGAPLFRT